MKNSLVILTFAATPFFLAGCGKSCEGNLERQAEIGQELAANPGNAEALMAELQELQDDYVASCTQE